MKVTAILAAVGLAATANAHAIAQRIRINGADQGLTTGFRWPNDNNPIENVNDGAMACGRSGSKSNTVVNVPAGASAGIQWQHVMGGPQGSNDADNPIAASHKGPISVYLAKVSDANSASSSGQSWFKIAHEGLSGGTWAVDRMISGNGWWNFQFPSCIASGHYLLRVELLALHSASSQGAAQFYVSCVQINITGGGSSVPSGVSFPGYHSATHPGILVSIYGSSGRPDNGGRSYTIPGPAIAGCTGNNNPQPTTTTARPQTTGGSNNGSGAPLYGQCGGIGWTGPTSCAQGRCVANGSYYSQCVP